MTIRTQITRTKFSVLLMNMTYRILATFAFIMVAPKMILTRAMNAGIGVRFRSLLSIIIDQRIFIT